MTSNFENPQVRELGSETQVTPVEVVITVSEEVLEALRQHAAQFNSSKNLDSQLENLPN